MSVLASPPSSGTASLRPVIDARGPRFAAALTTLVLALVLISIPSPVATTLLAAQVVVFGLGAAVGLQAQPYGVLYRRFVRPRLGPPAHLEDAAPPRFAQAVGLLFALVGLLGLLVDAPLVAYVAVALALVAAFLNTAFDFCLGCEIYLLAARLRARVAGSSSPSRP